MIRIKLGNTQRVLDVLNNVAQQRLPVSIALKLQKLGAAVVVEHKHFEKLRLKICNDLCDKDEKGEPILDKGSDGKGLAMYTFNQNKEEFEKQFNDLLNQDIEIDFKPIPASALDSAKITTHEVGMLKPFLID